MRDYAPSGSSCGSDSDARSALGLPSRNSSLTSLSSLEGAKPHPHQHPHPHHAASHPHHAPPKSALSSFLRVGRTRAKKRRNGSDDSFESPGSADSPSAQPTPITTPIRGQLSAKALAILGIERAEIPLSSSPLDDTADDIDEPGETPAIWLSAAPPYETEEEKADAELSLAAIRERLVAAPWLQRPGHTRGLSEGAYDLRQPLRSPGFESASPSTANPSRRPLPLPPRAWDTASEHLDRPPSYSEEPREGHARPRAYSTRKSASSLDLRTSASFVDMADMDTDTPRGSRRNSANRHAFRAPEPDELRDSRTQTEQSPLDAPATAPLSEAPSMFFFTFLPLPDCALFEITLVDPGALPSTPAAEPALALARLISPADPEAWFKAARTVVRRGRDLRPDVPLDDGL